MSTITSTPSHGPLVPPGSGRVNFPSLSFQRPVPIDDMDHPEEWEYADHIPEDDPHGWESYTESDEDYTDEDTEDAFSDDD